uniref:Uncharacterized protein n=1 Tax=Arundo donax TaxID=35708 RepID=A0A0A9DL14_ARUDO
MLALCCSFLTLEKEAHFGFGSQGSWEGGIRQNGERLKDRRSRRKLVSLGQIISYPKLLPKLTIGLLVLHILHRRFLHQFTF